MGTTFSAEKNTSIQDTLSRTINEFVSENSSTCETSTGASATLEIKNLTCGNDLNLGDINTKASTNSDIECLQANVTSADFDSFADDTLKSELKKESKNIIGMKISFDENATIDKSVQEVVNKVKASGVLNCLSTNLTTAETILENITAGGRCIAGDINTETESITRLKCIQQNKSVMKAVSELNKDIETILSTKSSGTGIVIMIIVVSIVALIIFIIIKKMKSSPPGGMALPMQMPMQMSSRLPMAYPV